MRELNFDEIDSVSGAGRICTIGVGTVNPPPGPRNNNPDNGGAGDTFGAGRGLPGESAPPPPVERTPDLEALDDF